MVGVLATGINWTAVLVTGVPAIIGALFSGVALLVVSLNRRALKTPSGKPIGEMAERAEHMASAASTSVGLLHRRLNGENVLPSQATDA